MSQLPSPSGGRWNATVSRCACLHASEQVSSRRSLYKKSLYNTSGNWNNPSQRMTRKSSYGQKPSSDWWERKPESSKSGTGHSNTVISTTSSQPSRNWNMKQIATSRGVELESFQVLLDELGWSSKRESRDVVSSFEDPVRKDNFKLVCAFGHTRFKIPSSVRWASSLASPFSWFFYGRLDGCSVDMKWLWCCAIHRSSCSCDAGIESYTMKYSNYHSSFIIKKEDKALLESRICIY